MQSEIRFRLSGSAGRNYPQTKRPKHQCEGKARLCKLLESSGRARHILTARAEIRSDYGSGAVQNQRSHEGVVSI
eukprot:4648543-Pleurochrysis_carterae.AAC.2